MRQRKEADHRTERQLQCGSPKIIGGVYLGSIRKEKYVVLSPSLFVAHGYDLWICPSKSGRIPGRSFLKWVLRRLICNMVAALHVSGA